MELLFAFFTFDLHNHSETDRTKRISLSCLDLFCHNTWYEQRTPHTSNNLTLGKNKWQNLESLQQVKKLVLEFWIKVHFFSRWHFLHNTFELKTVVLCFEKILWGKLLLCLKGDSECRHFEFYLVKFLLLLLTYCKSHLCSLFCFFCQWNPHSAISCQWFLLVLVVCLFILDPKNISLGLCVRHGISAVPQCGPWIENK